MSKRRATRWVARTTAILAAGAALTVALALPASADHGNWNMPTSVDAGETYGYVDSTSTVLWHIGSFSYRPCSYSITNERPDGHSVRVQGVNRTSGTIIFDTVHTWIASGATEGGYPHIGLQGMGSEFYMRYRWGDGAYGWREIDPIYNHPADVWLSVEFGSIFCP
jgi:hypothetical protein